MTRRTYVSPRREAQAAATRQRILDAFRAQLIEQGRDALSPSDAAAQAGCSVRTVHGYFPSRESRIQALAEYLDAELYPVGAVLPSSADELPAHYRTIHRAALENPIATVLISQVGAEWQEIRAQRRSARLDAIRRTVRAIGAPEGPTEDALGVLLALAGGEVSLAMRDQLGIATERIPDSIAHTVQLVIDDLRRL